MEELYAVHLSWQDKNVTEVSLQITNNDLIIQVQDLEPVPPTYSWFWRIFLQLPFSKMSFALMGAIQDLVKVNCVSLELSSVAECKPQM